VEFYTLPAPPRGVVSRSILHSSCAPARRQKTKLRHRKLRGPFLRPARSLFSLYILPAPPRGAKTKVAPPKVASPTPLAKVTHGADFFLTLFLRPCSEWFFTFFLAPRAFYILPAPRAGGGLIHPARQRALQRAVPGESGGRRACTGGVTPPRGDASHTRRTPHAKAQTAPTDCFEQCRNAW